MGISAVVSAAVGVFGMFQQQKGAKRQARATEAASAASRRQEAARRRQAELTARRQRIEAFRQSTFQRAQSVAALTSSGNIGVAGTSPAQGALSAIGARGNAQAQGVEQGLDIFRTMSNEADNISTARASSASGQAQQSLGGQIIRMAPAAGRVAQQAFSFFT